MSLRVAIPEGELLTKLEVTPPYLAFHEVEEHQGNTVYAGIRPEQPLYQESGVVAASEVGRHLALLGSIALSRRNPRPGRHYYLAKKARLQNLQPSLWVEQPEKLVAVSEHTEFDGKSGYVQCALFTPGPKSEKLFKLETSYQVLSEKLFSRMFKLHRVQTPRTTIASPYAADDPIKIQFLSNTLCSSEAMAVSTENCAGHFPDYPSLPVAILMGRLARVAGMLLEYREMRSPNSYAVLNAEIAAHRLAFAGEQLRFEATFLNTQGETHNFCCRTLNAEQEIFGEMTIALQCV